MKLYCLAIVILLVSMTTTQPQKTGLMERWKGCLMPEEPRQGYFTLNERKRTIKYNCNEGFQMYGMRFDQTRKCKRTGRWYPHLDTGRCLLKYPNNCPRLNAPANGEIIQLGANDIGGIVEFYCKEGYVLDGSTMRTCLTGRQWDGIQPMCESRRTAEDVAMALKSKIVDKFKGQANARLSASNGLDAIFLMDTSASIGNSSLRKGLEFIKTIVKTFGVSSPAEDGTGGTQVGVVIFAEQPEILFNLNTYSTVEDVLEKIDSIKITGGGTNLPGALGYAMTLFITDKRRKGSTRASRAVFLITDAEDTTMSAEESKMSRQRRANNLKDVGCEIFTIGIGKGIQWKALQDIASPPYAHHVFNVKDFGDLPRIGEIISEKNIDYRGCGLSGDTYQATHSGTARQGAWPWIGWLQVMTDGRPITCGGALLCNRWFITAAHCVYNITGQEALPGETITVHLGDHDLYKNDRQDTTVRPARVLVHPLYNVTEEAPHGVRSYDIALLDFGENETSLPSLNNFTRPICAPSNTTSNVLRVAVTELTVMKTNVQTERAGSVAGWGFSPSLTYKIPAVFPYANLTQTKRTVTGDKRCGRTFPNLDTTRFFCVSSYPETETCRAGDVGGPYMALIDKWVSMLGIALKTDQCEKSADNSEYTSIYLNTLDPDIVEWLGEQLNGCNTFSDCKENKQVSDMPNMGCL